MGVLTVLLAVWLAINVLVVVVRTRQPSSRHVLQRAALAHQVTPAQHRAY